MAGMMVFQKVLFLVHVWWFRSETDARMPMFFLAACRCRKIVSGFSGIVIKYIQICKTKGRSLGWKSDWFALGFGE
jgi:hypothetical protein